MVEVKTHMYAFKHFNGAPGICFYAYCLVLELVVLYDRESQVVKYFEKSTYSKSLFLRRKLIKFVMH